MVRNRKPPAIWAEIYGKTGAEGTSLLNHSEGIMGTNIHTIAVSGTVHTRAALESIATTVTESGIAVFRPYSGWLIPGHAAEARTCIAESAAMRAELLLATDSAAIASYIAEAFRAHGLAVSVNAANPAGESFTIPANITTQLYGPDWTAEIWMDIDARPRARAIPDFLFPVPLLTTEEIANMSLTELEHALHAVTGDTLQTVADHLLPMAMEWHIPASTTATAEAF